MTTQLDLFATKSRRANKAQNLLDRLRRGPTLSSELYDNWKLYGRNMRARVSELRKRGHVIEVIESDSGVSTYRLKD